MGVLVFAYSSFTNTKRQKKNMNKKTVSGDDSNGEAIYLGISFLSLSLKNLKIVSFLGVAIQAPELCFLYKYCSQRSLINVLCNTDKYDLGYEIMLKCALYIACGLVAKVTDFGLAEMVVGSHNNNSKSEGRRKSNPKQQQDSGNDSMCGSSNNNNNSENINLSSIINGGINIDIITGRTDTNDLWTPDTKLTMTNNSSNTIRSKYNNTHEPTNTTTNGGGIDNSVVCTGKVTFPSLIPTDTTTLTQNDSTTSQDAVIVDQTSRTVLCELDVLSVKSCDGLQAVNITHALGDCISSGVTNTSVTVMISNGLKDKCKILFIIFPNAKQCNIIFEPYNCIVGRDIFIIGKHIRQFKQPSFHHLVTLYDHMI